MFDLNSGDSENMQIARKKIKKIIKKNGLSCFFVATSEKDFFSESVMFDWTFLQWVHHEKNKNTGFFELDIENINCIDNLITASCFATNISSLLAHGVKFLKKECERLITKHSGIDGKCFMDNLLTPKEKTDYKSLLEFEEFIEISKHKFDKEFNLDRKTSNYKFFKKNKIKSIKPSLKKDEADKISLMAVDICNWAIDHELCVFFSIIGRMNFCEYFQFSSWSDLIINEVEVFNKNNIEISFRDHVSTFDVLKGTSVINFFYDILLSQTIKNNLLVVRIDEVLNKMKFI